MTKVFFSYDYELLWGVWDKTSPQYLANNVAGANSVVEAIIKTHQAHGIPATFAIVGAMLEGGAADELFRKTGRPEEEFGRFKEVLQTSDGDVLKANPTGISEILNDDLFEIGSHTYSHCYALESSEAVIRSEFAAMNEVFERKFGHLPKSLVMPKNQTTPLALDVASEYGIEVVRVNPDSWLYRPVEHGGAKAKLIRLLRYADAYLPVLELFPDRSENEHSSQGLVLNRGQYFFRPDLGNRIADRAHLLRLCVALRRCIVREDSCHFWSHPHNFGRNPERSIHNLNRLLRKIRQLADDGKVSAHRMDEIQVS
jgi:hypothetical protein